MDKIEAYLFLFGDNFMGNFVIAPIHQSSVLEAMLIFGGYDQIMIYIAALTSSLLAFCTNWLFGRMLASCIKSNKPLNNRFSLMADKHLPNICFMAFVPLVGIASSTMSGFFKLKISKIILQASAGYAIFFAYLIMT